MASMPKSKLGFFSTYDILLTKIEANKVDAYDMCYVKQTNTFYILDKDLNPIEFKSRLYVYESTAEALEDINSRTDTYAGQVICVYTGDRYVPYVVNETSGTYDISRVGIDNYDELQNKPIQNITADAGDGLILSDLEDGYYSIVGTYRISEGDATQRITSSSILFSVKTNVETDTINIVEFNANRILFYSVVDGTLFSDRYVLESELNTEITDTVEVIFDTKFDERFDEKIQADQATDEDIENLFNG